MRRLFNWRSIRVRLLAGYGLLFICAILMVSVGIHSMVKRTMEADIENELKNSTATILAMVRTSADTSIKNHLRAIAQNNRDIVESIYKQYQEGLMTEQEARNRARSILLAQHIGKTGYLYCVDSTGVAVVHKDPGVQGRNFAYREFVQEQIRRKEGYLTYDWRNPGELEPRPKALYMTYFAPWDWIISASSYREEFINLVNVDDFRDNILSQRFGRTGYSYVIDGRGNFVIHPSLKGNINDIPDPGLRETAWRIVRQKTGKIVYDWKNPDDTAHRKKIVFLNHIPELDWVVASSGYLDEINGPLDHIRNVIVMITVGAMLFILLLTLWISSTITSPLRRLMGKFEAGATGDFTVRMEETSTSEVGQLARFFNAFMEKLQLSSKSLHDEILSHRKSLEALRESEERFRSLAENSPDIIVRIGQDGTITYINPAVEKVLGYSREEVLGKDFVLFTRKSDSPEYIRNFTRMKETRETIVDFNGVLLHKDGSMRYFIFCGAPSTNYQGAVTGIEGILKDITERKQLESQLQQSQKLEAVGTLAGGIAHDFNNILTAIRGSLDLAMLMVEADHPVSRNLKHIEHASVRASELTRQLLLFSRKQPMESAPIDLNAAVEGILKIVERLIGEDISISADLDDGLMAFMADRTNIDQVIMNLIINARDAMPCGGRISIRTENRTIDEEYVKRYPYARTGRFVCLTLADSGTGMDQETIRHIFEPFFTTKETGRGTGLGLAVVYGIIKQHRGWINVSSTPNEGTTFRIYFPAVTVKPVKEGPVVRLVEKLEGAGERILIVEDDPDVLTFAASALTSQGYTVFCARSSREALEVFAEEKQDFRMVFSDVVLTDRNGIDLVDDLLGLKTDLRVLMTSGYMDEKSRTKLIRECRHPFLPKPYTMYEMLKAIRQVLEEDLPARQESAA